MQAKAATTAILGVAQTLAWASSYYLPAIVAVMIGRDIGVSVATVFGAFSFALLVAACVGPLAGKYVDRHGGRGALISSSIVFAAGLAALSQVTQILHLFAAWAVIGVAMGGGLYEAAFATVVRLHGKDARRAITGITLFAGFASTLGWPLSTWFADLLGWRGACLVWAVIHLCLGLPLNASIPKLHDSGFAATAGLSGPSLAGARLSPHRQRRAAALLGFIFAATWFVGTAMAAHLPRVLIASGATASAAIAVAALVGPAQVVGRLLEFRFFARAHPLLSAYIAALAYPVGAFAVGFGGASMAATFSALHGLSNGILTIAIGTLPLLLFGAEGYGRRQGMLMVPARFAQAGAPFLFGIALDSWGLGSLWVSALLGIGVFVALLLLAEDAKDAASVPTR